MSDEGRGIEPELQQPLPRRIRLKRAAVFETIVLTAGLIVLGGFAVGMLAWEAWLLHCDRVAASDGIEVYVHVVGKGWRIGRWGRTTAFFLTYKFRGAVDETLEASRNISMKDYERIDPGDLLVARAVPGRFEYHYLVHVPRVGLTWWEAAGLVAFIAVAPFLVSMYLGQKRREKDLIRYGKIVPAMVVRKSPVKSGLSRYEVTFHAARTEHKIVGIASSVVAETGDSVTVLHDPLDPGKAAIYAGCAYRAAAPG